MSTYNSGDSAPPFSDTSVDNYTDQTSVIDSLAPLDFGMSDQEIVKNLNQRVDDSQSYWNSPEGFDLQASRSRNIRMHLGKQVDTTNLYRFQTPYIENQIFIGEESIVAYTTTQIPQPEVIPASKGDRDKLFAADLEKGIKAYSEDPDLCDLEALVDVSVRNLLNKHIGLVKFRFDKNYGDNGDIICEAIDPSHVIIDKNVAKGKNPLFICHVLKESAEQLCARFPKKRDEIFKALGIVRGTPKQMSQELAVREVWVTHFNKKGEAEEGVATYFGDVVLDKMRNPNWLYSSPEKNFLKVPLKPFIPLNYINYGTHWIDETTPVSQAIKMQEILNKRGRQIMENADKANGMLVISTDSGLTKDDAQNLTGDPNQKLIIKTAGQPVTDLVYQVPPHDLPNYVVGDKGDVRMQIGNIMGAPTDFSGSNAEEGDPTLGEVVIKKNQAGGRQDLIVRAIRRFTTGYYRYLVQMMVVWYDEKRDFTFNAGDGEFDYITLSRDLIPKGINVKATKAPIPDKARQEAIAINLIKTDKIALIDAYKDLHLENPQQRYDNWAKEKANPMELARDSMDVVDESEAYVAYLDIMAGKDIEVIENPTTEYVLSLRKLMINDTFLKSDAKKQRKFIEYVNKCIDSLMVRTSLEEMSTQAPAGQELRPEVPLTPPAPMPQPGQPMGQPPQGMTSAPGGMPPPQMPPQGMPPGVLPPMPQGPPTGMPMGMPPPPPGAPISAPQPGQGPPINLANILGGQPGPSLQGPTMPPMV